MNEKEAKCFIESLIFSAEEPLTKDSMKKILINYGEFDLTKILEDLKTEETFLKQILLLLTFLTCKEMQVDFQCLLYMVIILLLIQTP